MSTMHQNAFGGRAADRLGKLSTLPQTLATMVGLLLRGKGGGKRGEGKEREGKEKGREGG